eukprot:365599-Chlamydomonas_euryale.AAC.1
MERHCVCAPPAWRDTDKPAPTVCTYWLRGLCMKGDSCGFLHQYDQEKMPVCRNLVRVRAWGCGGAAACVEIGVVEFCQCEPHACACVRGSVRLRVRRPFEGRSEGTLGSQQGSQQTLNPWISVAGATRQKAGRVARHVTLLTCFNRYHTFIACTAPALPVPHLHCLFIQAQRWGDWRARRVPLSPPHPTPPARLAHRR